MTIYDIGNEVEGKRVNLFPKYWIEGQFLMENGVYVYKEENLSLEDLYLNKQLISFIEDLGYLGAFHMMR